MTALFILHDRRVGSHNNHLSNTQVRLLCRLRIVDFSVESLVNGDIGDFDNVCEHGLIMNDHFAHIIDVRMLIRRGRLILEGNFDEGSVAFVVIASKAGERARVVFRFTGSWSLCPHRFSL